MSISNNTTTCISEISEMFGAKRARQLQRWLAHMDYPYEHDDDGNSIIRVSTLEQFMRTLGYFNRFTALL